MFHSIQHGVCSALGFTLYSVVIQSEKVYLYLYVKQCRSTGLTKVITWFLQYFANEQFRKTDFSYIVLSGNDKLVIRIKNLLFSHSMINKVSKYLYYCDKTTKGCRPKSVRMSMSRISICILTKYKYGLFFWVT